MNDYHIEEWRDEFLIEYYQHTNVLPIIIPGTRPPLDIQVVAQSRGKNAWFWYPFLKYSPRYWNRFLDQDHDDVVIHISTAIQISETIGIPVDERNMPNVWIVAMEKL